MQKQSLSETDRLSLQSTVSLALLRDGISQMQACQKPKQVSSCADLLYLQLGICGFEAWVPGPSRVLSAHSNLTHYGRLLKPGWSNINGLK